MPGSRFLGPAMSFVIVLGSAHGATAQADSFEDAAKRYIVATTLFTEPPSYEIGNAVDFAERLDAAMMLADERQQQAFVRALHNDAELRRMSESPEWLHGIDVVRTGAHIERPGLDARVSVAEDGSALIWVVGWNGLIFRSDNHGAAWTRLDAGVNANFEAVDFVDETTGIVVGHNGTILKTVDGGGTWRAVTGTGTSLHRDVDCLDALRCWTVGDYAHVYRTADGGMTWQASSGFAEESLRSILMLDEDTGFAGGRGVWRTSDGGETWMKIIDLAGPAPGVRDIGDWIAALDSADGQSVWAVGRIDGDIGILASTDGGTSWTDQSPFVYPRDYLDLTELPAPEVHRANDVYALSANVAYLVATNGVILATVDGGQHWFVQEARGNADFSFYAIAMRDARVGWAAGSYGMVAATNEGGRAWALIRGRWRRFLEIAAETLDVAVSMPGVHDIERLIVDGKLDEAIALAGRMSEAAPDDATLVFDLLKPLYEHGRQLYRDKRFAEAAALFGSLIEAAVPRLATSTGDEDLALLVARLYYRHGMSLRRTRVYDDALASLYEALVRTDALLRADPDRQMIRDLMSNVQHNRGRVFEALDRSEDAIAAYVETVRYDPDDDIAFKRRGVLAFKKGAYAQAIEDLEKAVALDPEYTSAMNWLAWIYVTAGLPQFHDPQRAADLARSALKLRPSAAVYDTLAAALLRLGDGEAAVQAYMTALAMDENYKKGVVEDLQMLAFLPSDVGTPTDAEMKTALERCVAAGIPQGFLSQTVELIERIRESDPANARRHLEVLADLLPDNEEVRRLLSEAESWPAE